MSSAARRVLKLFLQTPKRGVAGVTGVTRPFVTSKNPMVTPITPVTYQKQVSPAEGVTGVHAAPLTRAETLAFEARIIEWLDGNPAQSPAGRCAWCGQLESDSASIVPFGTEPGIHAWVHGACWRMRPGALRRSRLLARLGALPRLRHRASDRSHGAPCPHP